MMEDKTSNAVDTKYNNKVLKKCSSTSILKKTTNSNNTNSNETTKKAQSRRASFFEACASRRVSGAFTLRTVKKTRFKDDVTVFDMHKSRDYDRTSTPITYSFLMDSFHDPSILPELENCEEINKKIRQYSPNSPKPTRRRRGVVPGKESKEKEFVPDKVAFQVRFSKFKNLQQDRRTRSKKRGGVLVFKANKELEGYQLPSVSERIKQGRRCSIAARRVSKAGHMSTSLHGSQSLVTLSEEVFDNSDSAVFNNSTLRKAASFSTSRSSNKTPNHTSKGTFNARDSIGTTRRSSVAVFSGTSSPLTSNFRSGRIVSKQSPVSAVSEEDEEEKKSTCTKVNNQQEKAEEGNSILVYPKENNTRWSNQNLNAFGLDVIEEVSQAPSRSSFDSTRVCGSLLHDIPLFKNEESRRSSSSSEASFISDVSMAEEARDYATSKRDHVANLFSAREQRYGSKEEQLARKSSQPNVLKGRKSSSANTSVLKIKSSDNLCEESSQQQCPEDNDSGNSKPMTQSTSQTKPVDTLNASEMLRSKSSSMRSRSPASLSRTAGTPTTTSSPKHATATTTSTRRTSAFVATLLNRSKPEKRAPTPMYDRLETEHSQRSQSTENPSHTINPQSFRRTTSTSASKRKDNKINQARRYSTAVPITTSGTMNFSSLRKESQSPPPTNKDVGSRTAHSTTSKRTGSEATSTSHMQSTSTTATSRGREAKVAAVASSTTKCQSPSPVRSYRSANRGTSGRTYKSLFSEENKTPSPVRKSALSPSALSPSSSRSQSKISTTLSSSQSSSLMKSTNSFTLQKPAATRSDFQRSRSGTSKKQVQTSHRADWM
eukprot:m.38782 g.38782  ORF g.38782 m.38782 type:complete len:829 (+) comp10242_c0_seq1:138-2624(+)